MMKGTTELTKWRCDCRSLSMCSGLFDPAHLSTIIHLSQGMGLLRDNGFLGRYTQMGYWGNTQREAGIHSLRATPEMRYEV